WDALSRDELSELEKRLRNLVLRSASTLPDPVRNYLKRVLDRRRLRQVTFAQIAAFTPTLATTHAVEVVDIALAELVGELPKETVECARSGPLFGYSSFTHDWHDLAIEDGHGAFHPPSPLREPFHGLFKVNPAEALGLVRTLCNHAMTAWRQLFELDPQRRDIPIPLQLAFSWATENDLGNAQEYAWFGGMGGPQVIECALMALEEWAFTQVESGRELDEVLRDVLTGNECCAVLGIASTLALAHNHLSAVTLPLATSQRLW